MVQPIIHDTLFLQRRAERCGREGSLTEEEKQVGTDLLDTLSANRERCVGLAANMIGKNLAIIVVSLGPVNVLMVNPVITKKQGAYEAEEGCLSLDGTRKTARYRKITVVYRDRDFQERKQDFTGFPAQIIQHECDHLDGILI